MSADEVAKDIVDAALKVHRALGPGLLESAYLESAYQACLAHELERDFDTRRHPAGGQKPSGKTGRGIRIRRLTQLHPLFLACFAFLAFRSSGGGGETFIKLALMGRVILFTNKRRHGLSKLPNML
jgi:PD-(D/E)XK nuclease superfamily protein